LPEYLGIRFHESLRGSAPQYVLEYLIYHECLHFQWAIHCPAFNNADRKFKHYKKADQWLERHVYLLNTE
jgi:predicted metal-dependent hydrolase